MTRSVPDQPILQTIVGKSGKWLEALGGEDGCKRLSTAFYARVKTDPILQPLFPGKSLRCATEEFSAFLIQFLDGAEERTQYRWWLSLHESHARFHIGPAERAAWLKQMRATLDATALDDETRKALKQFFMHSSAYIVDKATVPLEDKELATRWNEQLVLERAIDAIRAGQDREALAIAPRFSSRPSVFVGLLARMMQSGRDSLIAFVIQAAEHDPSLVTHHFNGKTLLHFGAGAGCLAVVTLLLRLGANPNMQDRSGHTPLYCVANECASNAGAEIVQMLVVAGADVNQQGGVTQATALHMAARRGHLEIAEALLDHGASLDVKDRKGETALQRAVNCRKHAVAQLLLERSAVTAFQIK